ncbi:hypothetical protein Tcan_06083 [Toxocara canis]|uniref:Uncharacterized protein n=1 Tax=Toxocara canis TaxID=6265 RepID=A0A0B2VHC9_TOXCA|nr:hypothetical protein Tcan_06083 [Toxocara canis]
MIPFMTTRGGIGTQPIPPAVPSTGVPFCSSVPHQPNNGFIHLTNFQPPIAPVYARQGVFDFYPQPLVLPSNLGWGTHFTVPYMANAAPIEPHNGVVPMALDSTQPLITNYSPVVGNNPAIRNVIFPPSYATVHPPIESLISHGPAPVWNETLRGGMIPAVSPPAYIHQWDVNHHQPTASHGFVPGTVPTSAFGTVGGVQVGQVNPQSTEERRPLYERRGVLRGDGANSNQVGSNLVEQVANRESEGALGWALRDEEYLADINGLLNDGVSPINGSGAERAQGQSPSPSAVDGSFLESLEEMEMEEEMGTNRSEELSGDLESFLTGSTSSTNTTTTTTAFTNSGRQWRESTGAEPNSDSSAVNQSLANLSVDLIALCCCMNIAQREALARGAQMVFCMREPSSLFACPCCVTCFCDPYNLEANQRSEFEDIHVNTSHERPRQLVGLFSTRTVSEPSDSQLGVLVAKMRSQMRSMALTIGVLALQANRDANDSEIEGVLV